LKVRIKYTKTGPLRFISHLDVMRYFQKAIRRAEFDIKYSSGFSPHQIISFAAPMPLMLTSVGEYMDAEFNSLDTSEDMIRRFNETASPYAQITDMVILPDNAGNSMSVVCGSDYLINLTESGLNKFSDIAYFKEALLDANKKSEILISKKTKKNEKITDIKPSIFELSMREDGIYMLLSAGSVDNLKPELVMEAMCIIAGCEYSRYDFDILRLDTYMRDKNKKMVPLIEAGDKF